MFQVVTVGWRGTGSERGLTCAASAAFQNILTAEPTRQNYSESCHPIKEELNSWQKAKYTCPRQWCRQQAIKLSRSSEKRQLRLCPHTELLAHHLLHRLQPRCRASGWWHSPSCFCDAAKCAIPEAKSQLLHRRVMWTSSSRILGADTSVHNVLVHERPPSSSRFSHKGPPYQ